jgi:hypothetical protein
MDGHRKSYYVFFRTEVDRFMEAEDSEVALADGLENVEGPDASPPTPTTGSSVTPSSSSPTLPWLENCRYVLPPLVGLIRLKRIYNF